MSGESPQPRSVLVTGCSSGFGELIARTLATHGMHVFATMRDIAARNAAPAERLRAWAQQAQVKLEVLELDVMSDSSVSAAVGQVLAAAGTIDVLVNNAGASAVGPIEAFSMAQIEGIVGLNAFGPIRVSKAVLPTMRARRAGLIVVISSTLGRVLPGRGGLYPASKWATEGLAESLRYQVAPFGVDLTILEPGSYPTPAGSKSIVADDPSITAAYAAVTPPPPPPEPASDDYVAPDPQEVADAVKQLVELPPGQRPLRLVVGHVFTAGVAEYNAIYEQTRDRLADVLRRPDQATPWARRASSSVGTTVR